MLKRRPLLRLTRKHLNLTPRRALTPGFGRQSGSFPKVHKRRAVRRLRRPLDRGTMPKYPRTGHAL